MTLRIIVGVGVVLAVLLVVVAVNTLRVGPPVLSDVSPALDVVIDEDAAAERLAEAVRFRTISSSPDAPVSKSALLGLRQFLADNYPNVHGILKREIVNEYSLLYTWQGNEPDLKPILLAAHMDVVPVEPGTEADWIHPPFASIVADGFIWGRGTMDMKASLMGIMEAAEYLLGRGFTPQRTIYLAFGHDEEIGGSNGAAKIAALLSERGVRLEFTLDEGLVITHGIVPGVTRPAALIGVAEKRQNLPGGDRAWSGRSFIRAANQYRSEQVRPGARPVDHSPDASSVAEPSRRYVRASCARDATRYAGRDRQSMAF